MNSQEAFRIAIAARLTALVAKFAFTRAAKIEILAYRRPFADAGMVAPR